MATQPISTATTPPELSFSTLRSLKGKLLAFLGSFISFFRIIASAATAFSNWNRTGEVVHTIRLAISFFDASVTFIITAPSSNHRALYMACQTVAYLALVTSTSLCLVAILFAGSPSVGWLQRKLIYISGFFVLFSYFFRLLFVLPLADVRVVATLVMTGSAAILLYLLICRRRQDERGETHSSAV